MYSEDYYANKKYKNKLPIQEKEWKQVCKIFSDNDFFEKYHVSIYTHLRPYDSSVEFTPKNKLLKEFDFAGFTFFLTLRTMVCSISKNGELIQESWKEPNMYYQPRKKYARKNKSMNDKEKTIEEVAYLWSIQPNNPFPPHESYIAKEGFLAGVKWQKEQAKVNHKEEMLDFAQKIQPNIPKHFLESIYNETFGENKN